MHQYLAVPTPKCNHIISTNSETLSNIIIPLPSSLLKSPCQNSGCSHILIKCLYCVSFQHSLFIHRWSRVISFLKSAGDEQGGEEAENPCPSKPSSCTTVQGEDGNPCPSKPCSSTTMQGNITTSSLWSGAALSAQAHHLIWTPTVYKMRKDVLFYPRTSPWKEF